MSTTKWTCFFHETAHRSTATTETNKSASLTSTKTIYSTYWHFWNHIAHPVTLQYPHRIQTDHYTIVFSQTRIYRTTDKTQSTKPSTSTATPSIPKRVTKNLIKKRMTEHKQGTTVKSANTLVNIYNRRTMLPTWTLRKVSLQRYLVSTTDSRKMVHSLSKDSGLEQTPLMLPCYHANDLFSQFTKQTS